MNSRTILRFDEIGPDDAEAVGGKGLNLGLMTREGLPVPPGFCLACEAHRRARHAGGGLDDAARGLLLDAYRALGGGPVAVRSSANAEDGADASFAGQQETFLGIEGEEALVDAVARCWASLDSDRARAYRRKQGVDEAAVAMGVVVQRLVPAEVAGVLFTRDPTDPGGTRMLVEAARGLGELVVSGRVDPDRFGLDRATGRVLDRQIQSQAIQLMADGLAPVAAAQRDQACLDAPQLAELAGLGRRVEAYYGAPRDIEWARADGRFWLLQARPITTAGAFEREQVRREEVAALAARADPAGTVWARYNLAEVLPDPKPMSWAIVGRLMSGLGGYGLMYRDLGFDPDPALDREGFIDLICGRPYVNLGREAMLHFRGFPYTHDFAALKADPARAMYPQPTIDRARLTGRFWLRLPGILLKMTRAHRTMAKQGRTQADRLRREVFPRFAREAESERAVDYGPLPSGDLLDRLDHWSTRTLETFARESLRPAMFAALALADLERKLAAIVGPDRAPAEARALLTGIRPDPDGDLPTALAALARGELDRGAFLAGFGHRGPGEMELAQPRWAEAPESLPKPGGAGRRPHAAPPARSLDAILEGSAPPAAARRALEATLAEVATFLGLRESAKHHLMMGYAVLRRLLVELDRRHGLGGGIFHLTPEELPRLVAGEPLTTLIEARRRRRRLALSLDAPPVLFSDDLDAIGRPATPADGAAWKGTPISAGVAEGEALVLTDPAGAPEGPEGFILVCPSTDPAWLLLFLRARGLVMETGGVLSHGAIVAREFGLPAVAGLPGVLQQLRTGQRIRVDGNAGVVHILD